MGGMTHFEREDIYMVNYSTEKIPYPEMVNKVLEKKEILCAEGYNCDWKDLLDLSKKEDLSRLGSFGYLQITDKCILTSFGGEGFLFHIAIYPDENLSRIQGSDSTVPKTRLPGVKERVKRLEEILELKINFQEELVKERNY